MRLRPCGRELQFQDKVNQTQLYVRIILLSYYDVVQRQHSFCYRLGNARFRRDNDPERLPYFIILQASFNSDCSENGSFTIAN